MLKTKIGVSLAVLSLFVPMRAYAQTPSSTNYSVEESSFSSGSDFNVGSASYSASGSAGNLGVGNAFSANYGAYAGPINPNEEYLEMTVNVATIDLDTPSGDPGILSEAETAFGSGTFYVRAYLNSSYSVVTLSQPPTNESGDVLTGMSATAAPTAGTEEFGINLVANSTPLVGADPAPDPSAVYANGEAATGYDTADQYRYVAGETIAQNGGTPAWGQTNYTISYIANISSITAAGSYTMEHDFTAVPTF